MVEMANLLILCTIRYIELTLFYTYNAISLS